MQVERNSDKRRLSPSFVEHVTILLRKIEVKTMETLEKHGDKSTQSWTKRMQKHPREEDYYPELRRWVQHSIMEAEKNKDFHKKDQLLDLLRDL
jgi:hypothetical protein